MKSNSFFALVILVSCCLQGSAIRSEQREHSVHGTGVLERQVEKKDDGYINASYAFMNSLVSTRVPGGFVSISRCDDRIKAQTGYLPEGTLRERLDTIVQRNPEWRWEIDEDVVNFLPVDGDPPLLKVRIKRLTVTGATSITQVLDKALELPELKGEIATLGLSPGLELIIGPRPLAPEPPKYFVDYKNMTLREILNALVRAHGFAIWRYEEKRCNGKVEFLINFAAQ